MGTVLRMIRVVLPLKTTNSTYHVQNNHTALSTLVLKNPFKEDYVKIRQRKIFYRVVSKREHFRFHESTLRCNGVIYLRYKAGE